LTFLLNVSKIREKILDQHKQMSFTQNAILTWKFRKSRKSKSKWYWYMTYTIGSQINIKAP